MEGFKNKHSYFLNEPENPKGCLTKNINHRRDYGNNLAELLYYPTAHTTRAPAIIICPGGGYEFLCIDKEGEWAAEWLNKKGIHAFVLKYRLPSKKESSFPGEWPLLDIESALHKVYQLKDELSINNELIGLMGFSAGGHLAACGANLFTDTMFHPKFSILVYPVITMNIELTHLGSRQRFLGATPSTHQVKEYSMENRVSKLTPPTFIIHNQDDDSVPCKNTELYTQSLKNGGVKHLSKLIPTGGHGYGFDSTSPAFGWQDHLEDWLKERRIII